MAEIITILIFVAIYFFAKASTEAKINRIDPTKVDNSKMARDISNGVSRAEVNRRYGNGYYNKK